MAPVVDPDCSGGNGCNPQVAPGGEFVAGGGGTDSCFGDSGGPVYLDTPRGAVVIGAVSRGVDGAATPCGGGGIYVRTDKVIAWIEETAARAIAKDDCSAEASIPSRPTTRRRRPAAVARRTAAPPRRARPVGSSSCARRRGAALVAVVAAAIRRRAVVVRRFVRRSGRSSGRFADRPIANVAKSRARSLASPLLCAPRHEALQSLSSILVPPRSRTPSHRPTPRWFPARRSGAIAGRRRHDRPAPARGPMSSPCSRRWRCAAAR